MEAWLCISGEFFFGGIATTYRNDMPICCQKFVVAEIFNMLNISALKHKCNKRGRVIFITVALLFVQVITVGQRNRFFLCKNFCSRPEHYMVTPEEKGKNKKMTPNFNVCLSQGNLCFFTRKDFLKAV